MRIISDTHDFYDSVQSMGQDRTLVYVRKEKEILIRDFPFERMYQKRYHIIGFCGKVYAVLEFVKDGVTKFCYNMEDVNSFVEKYYSKKEKLEYEGLKKSYRPYFWSNVKKKDCEEFFQKSKEKENKFEYLFLENYSPIFIAEYNSQRYGKHKITFNVTLKKYDFFRLFDPYQAFQEISMYLGGIAVPQKEVPIPDDQIKLESHGFNKWSFRKEKVK